MIESPVKPPPGGGPPVAPPPDPRTRVMDPPPDRTARHGFACRQCGSPLHADQAACLACGAMVESEDERIGLRRVVAGSSAVLLLLGGAVGGSRVVTNLGWRPHSDQVGQTGARIAPDLYIACGVSGAIQHIVGCKGAKRILVINKDQNAPIVARADWAVIGDLHEIVPAIVAELRKNGT